MTARVVIRSEDREVVRAVETIFGAVPRPHLPHVDDAARTLAAWVTARVVERMEVHVGPQSGARGRLPA